MEKRKKHSIAMALALLLTFSGSAWAAVVTVVGQAVDEDPEVALEAARADAIAQCTAQGGTPLEEVSADLSWWSKWIGTSIWDCDVP
jgi:hypothetical protein